VGGYNIVKALVTGSTGFIGSHLATALIEKDYRVTCLVRKTSDVSRLEKLGVEVAYGDMLDANSLINAVRGVDVVYHLVGVGDISAVSAKAYEEYRQINVLGTKNLLDACLSSGVGKLVHFSSLAAMGLIRKDIIDEKTPCNPRGPYERSKYESEMVVLQYGEKEGLPATIIRPSMAYGPGGMKSEVLKMCRMIRKHIFPIIGSGNARMGMVYVDNLVQGAILAGENRKSVGETYIVTDARSYSLNEVVQTIAAELKVKNPAIHIPIPLAKAGVSLIEMLSKVLGFTPPFSLWRLETATIDRVYSIAKAQDELGYKPPVSLEEGVPNTIKWYRDNGLL
jgi:nucleoside-diphosphate-sugar epimerase